MLHNIDRYIRAGAWKALSQETGELEQSFRTKRHPD